METKLKPFDLAAALEGKKVITRDGQEVTEIHLFKTYKDQFKLFAIVNGYLRSYLENGNHCSPASSLDLFMAPETVTKWVNVYRPLEGSAIPFVGNKIYDSKEEAELGESLGYLTTTSITFDI